MTTVSAAAPASSGTCPFPHSLPPISDAYSVIDVLPGFTHLERRPETLNGIIPTRRAACKPYMEGNRTGLFIRFAEPVMLSRDPERPLFQMTDELYETVHGDYDDRLSELVARGLLPADGYWHRRLLDGPVVRQGAFASVWSGLLVKPAAGLWLLSTGSYNLRSDVNVKEVAVASDRGYTPLMIDLDLDSMPKDSMWLEAAIACLIPLQPGVRFTQVGIEDRLEMGAKHNEFYTEGYQETRAVGRVVGSYRKLAAQPRPLKPQLGPAECELIHIAGPAFHTIETFRNVVGPNGPEPPEIAAQLPFAMLRNITPLEFDFDGIQTHLNNDDADMHSAELTGVWSDLYGDAGKSSIEWMSQYFIPSTPTLIGEQNVGIMPYAFVSTPPGWSTVADGACFPGLDGLRGVLATDLFHHAGPIFQYRRPGDFKIAAGDPIMRLLPVPAHLLEAPHTVVHLANFAE